MEHTYLAIDYGTRRSGLAVGVAGVAVPHSIVPTPDLIHAVTRIVIERDIDTIVVGMPTHMDGRVCDLGLRVEVWIQKLRAILDLSIEIITWDERVSTAEARTSYGEMGIDTSRQAVDDIAASIFLQEYLDSLR